MHHVTPKSVRRPVNESAYVFRAEKGAGGGAPGRAAAAAGSSPAGEAEILAEMTREMLEAAEALEFEKAAYLRDQIAARRRAVVV